MQTTLSTLILALAVSQPPPRECYHTTNFTVYAESPEIAKSVGDSAERHRTALAQFWHGAKIADWSAPCRIDVTIAARSGGATDVQYARGKVLFQRVNVRGPLDRILTGPLPHELTHALFAHHFGFQPPRWADEGGAILAEGDAQREAMSRLFHSVFDQKRHFPLREFFAMRDYPADLPVLYAQGHSVCDFLVAAKGKKAFLTFVRNGMQSGWDSASKANYGYAAVEDLEKAWLDWAGKQAAARRPKTPRATSQLPVFDGEPGNQIEIAAVARD